MTDLKESKKAVESMILPVTLFSVTGLVGGVSDGVGKHRPLQSGNSE